MTICVQCALRAFVYGQTDYHLWTFPHESPAQHIARKHPDPVLAKLERMQLADMLCEQGKHDEDG